MINSGIRQRKRGKIVSARWRLIILKSKKAEPVDLLFTEPVLAGHLRDFSRDNMDKELLLIL